MSSLHTALKSALRSLVPSCLRRRRRGGSLGDKYKAGVHDHPLPDPLDIYHLCPSEARSVQTHIIKVLGEGHFGQCHLVLWNGHQFSGPAVVKVFTAEISERMVRKEAAMLHQANGAAGVPRLLAMSCNPPILIETYVRGRRLYDLLCESRFTDDQWYQVMSNLVKSVGELHSAGVVHNDLKTDNIMVDDNLGISLVDLGVSELCGVRPEYIVKWIGAAPEFLNRQPCCPASDVYSLGGIINKVISKMNDEHPIIGRVIKTSMAEDPDLRPTTNDMHELICEARDDARFDT